MKLIGNIGYLEDEDFNRNGRLLISDGKKSIVMVQAGWCGACANAKPLYQKFANSVKRNGSKINVFTIEIDGQRESQKELYARLNNVLNNQVQVIPRFVLYDNNGKMGKIYDEVEEIKSIRY